MIRFGYIIAVLAIAFGIDILIFPKIIAYMIGIFFIIMGTLFLARQWHQSRLGGNC